MKYFDIIVNNLIEAHKDPQTQYSPTQMFASKNDLSFAISRLMDAQKVFASEAFENKELPAELHTLWCSIRDDVPSEIAKDLAICIINNTPLSKTEKEINEVQELFYKTMQTYTENAALSKAFTEIFFGEVQAKKFNTRAF